MERVFHHIAVCGNIGSGKTTLAEKLARHFRAELFPENPQNNPYLKDFYSDMARWSFQVQVHFLVTRFSQTLEIQSRNGNTVQDRTLYEDANIFAANLFENGYLSERDYDTYRTLYTTFVKLINPPSLLIYLRADIPKLQSQIAKRGRDYEKSITREYLAALNERYEKWVKAYTGRLLIVDMTGLDYVESSNDLQFVVTQVADALR